MGFSAEATVKTKWAKMNAALFYGICSFMMVFINKYILSVLEFPSFLIFGILQMIVTVICLYIASKCSLITLPRLGMSVPKKIFPLPLLFFISLVSGLGGTQKISLPMFTALRHTTIFVTMILEYIILGTVPSTGVRLSVFFIIFGSMLAAIYDLSFDTYGYMLIFINNVTDSKIQKIQGLRGISIFVVLLFHIRSDWFGNGYLGVDVFFVISGFLMCHILNKEERLGRSQILEFYFRRIKRIIPVYLFIILIFLLSAVFMWMHPLYFNSFVEQPTQSLFFVANHINDVNYFTISNVDYKFFIHLWSLSVELQFYLIAPFLIVFLNQLLPFVKPFVVGWLALASFLYQWNATKNTEHMALCSRIWQFMFGFLAYYLSKVLLIEKKTNESIRYKLVDFFLNYGAAILFIVLINVDLTGVKAYNRLFLLLCTVVCIAYPSSNMLLTNTFLVELGNISYSVYLIHWFVFEAHRYSYFKLYLYGQKAELSVVIMLISISIALGYIVENTYNQLSKHLNNWKSLLDFIFVGYALIGATLMILDCHGALIRPNNYKMLHIRKYVDNTTMRFWRGDSVTPWNNDDAIGFNDALVKNRMNLFTCPKGAKNSFLPTGYNFTNLNITSTCYKQRNGTKNIVIIGNSHASSQFYGMERIFRKTYANITVIANHQCMFFELNKFRNVLTKDKFKSCQTYLDDMFKILRMWHHRIDIILVAQAFLIENDLPFTDDQINNDNLYQEMQAFYMGLSKIAAEVVFVPIGHIETGVNPLLKILRRQLYENDDLNMFRVPISFQFNLWPNFKKRSKAVQCPNCILLDWESLWCDKQKGYCDIIDFKHNLTYFGDKNHHTAYGSLVAANYAYQRYIDWQISKNLLVFTNVSTVALN
ncbi:TPT domain-containing protein [Aphelenchoides bicaudatus]|nr:TPT domain-containing protein [Aphelenchoides bicaudatus]